MNARIVVLLVLVVVAAVVALFVVSPQLRARASSVAGEVREDIRPGGASDTIGGEAKVYAPRGDTCYHTRECPRIQGKNAVPLPVSKAKELMYEPCPQCNPPA